MTKREQIVQEISRLERELALARWHLEQIDGPPPEPPPEYEEVKEWNGWTMKPVRRLKKRK